MIILFVEPIRMHEQAAGRDVTLGYGLHYGWAIEGAIGSNLKIDASYLSPHVNTAARLEAATKQFRTMFLLSDDFVKRLSPRNQVSVSKNSRVHRSDKRSTIRSFRFSCSWNLHPCFKSMKSHRRLLTKRK